MSEPEETKSTGGFWIPHCDDDCDLGRFEYTCLACDHVGDDFEMWWLFDDIVGNDEAATEFGCEHCKVRLTVYWDAEELETRVRLAEVAV